MVVWESAHHPLAVVHVHAVLCVCTVSQRAQLRAEGVWWQCTSALLACRGRARNGGSGSQAHSSHVGGCATSKLLCMLDPNHTDASLLTLCATHLPRGTLRGSWWKLAVRVPPMNGWSTCVSTAHLHQPRAYNQPSPQDGNQTLRVLSGHPHTRGRMSTRVIITPNLHSPRCPAYHLVQREAIQGLLRPPQPRRDHAPRSQVTRDSPSNPVHPACPLVSALPPRFVQPAILDPQCWPLPQRARARTS